MEALSHTAWRAELLRRSGLQAGGNKNLTLGCRDKVTIAYVVSDSRTNMSRTSSTGPAFPVPGRTIIPRPAVCPSHASLPIPPSAWTQPPSRVHSDNQCLARWDQERSDRMKGTYPKEVLREPRRCSPLEGRREQRLYEGAGAREAASSRGRSLLWRLLRGSGSVLLSLWVLGGRRVTEGR